MPTNANNEDIHLVIPTCNYNVVGTNVVSFRALLTTEHTLLDCITLLFCPSTTLFFSFPFQFILFPTRSLPLLYESPPPVPPPVLLALVMHACLPD